MDDPLSSSQAFIRALKASSDPPIPSSPLKIEIAAEAWAKKSLYIPSKQTVIVEWALGKLLKEREFESSSNPLLKSRYWSLLADIILSGDRKATGIWLSPILSRIPVIPIIASFIKRFADLQHSKQLSAIGELFKVWLDLALPKTSQESILELYWNALATFSTFLNAKPTDNCLEILALSVNAFRSVFTRTSTNKKKIHLLFVQSHLPDWFYSLYVLDGLNTNIRQLVYDSGEDVLFSQEASKIYVSLYSRGKDVSMSDRSTEGDLVRSIENFISSSLPRSTYLCSPFEASLPIIPSLFHSFIKSAQKNRSVLFGLGLSSLDASNQRQEQVNRTLAMNQRVKEAIVQFLNCLCSTLLASSLAESSPSKLRTKVQLLRLIDDGGIYDNTNTESVDIINKLTQLTVGALSDTPCISPALDGLSIILRLDFDIVEPLLPKILCAIAVCPKESSRSAVSFLSPLLDFHSKTRTLHAHISSVVHCLKSVTSSASDLKVVYHQVCTGPLFDVSYQRDLQRSVGLFLTSQQTAEVITFLANEITASWSKATESTGIGLSKQQLEYESIILAFLVYFTVEMLPVIPIESLPPNSIEDIKKEIHSLRYTVLNHSTMSASIDASLHVEKSLKPGRKKQKLRHGVEQPTSTITLQSEESSNWPSQLLLQSALQFLYMLQRHHQKFRLSTEVAEGTLERSRLIHLLEGKSTLAGLKLETTRILLFNSFHQPFSFLRPQTDVWATTRTIDICLSHMETSIIDVKVDAIADSSWNGAPFSIDKECDTNFGTAIWDIAFSRWLGVVDRCATTEQLSRLSNIILRLFSLTTVPKDKTIDFTPHDVLLRQLVTASFWECRRLRDALSDCFDTLTRPIDDIPTSILLTQSPVDRLEQTNISVDVTSLAPVFGILLHAPSEYLARNAKITFARRALTCDGMQKPSEEGSDSVRILLREIILRVVKDCGALEVFTNPADVASYLLSPWSMAETSTSSSFVDVSLNLIESIQLAIIQSSAKAGQDNSSIIQVINYYLSLGLFKNGSQPVALRDLQRTSMLNLLEDLLSQDSTSIAIVVRSAVSSAAIRIVNDVEPILQELLRDPSTSIDVHRPELFLRALRISQMVTRWNDGDSAETRDQSLALDLGKRLLGLGIAHFRRNTTRTDMANFCTEAFALILGETYQANKQLSEEQINTKGLRNLLELVVAAYISIMTMTKFPVTDSKENAWVSIDALLSSGCKTWAASTYSTAANIVRCHLDCAEDFDSKDFSATRCLLRLSRLMLKYCPQGSRMSAQQLMTSWMIYLAGNTQSGLILDREALLDILVFLKEECTERPLMLRATDVSYIWPILSAVLAPCTSLLPTLPSIGLSRADSTLIFSMVMGILNSLIRHRRDLVKPCLPHLAQLLSLSIKTLRTLRSGVVLGSKQNQLLLGTLPWWISLDKENSAQQLSGEGAKSLGRVLCALNVKSIVRDGAYRKHESIPDTAAQSLGKPFSKHASSVLITYTNVISGSDGDGFTQSSSLSGLTTLDRTSREGLEEGIYTLCSLVGEYGRDWVMENLNVDGKRVFKGLWADYEKQKYVGRG